MTVMKNTEHFQENNNELISTMAMAMTTPVNVQHLKRMRLNETWTEHEHII